MMFNKLINVKELLEAKLGFVIRDEDSDGLKFTDPAEMSLEELEETKDYTDRVLGLRAQKCPDFQIERTFTTTRYAYEADKHGFPKSVCIREKITDDNTQISDPYFTTTGNRPVIKGFAELRDMCRSKGGFSDLEIPEENNLDKLCNDIVWNDRKEQKARRAQLTAKIQRVIARMDNLGKVYGFAKRFRTALKTSRNKCSETGWDSVLVDKGQAKQIKDAIEDKIARIKRL